MRHSPVGLPVAAVCLAGFTAACSGHNPAGGAPTGQTSNPAGGTSAGHLSSPAGGTLTGHLYGAGGLAPTPLPWPGTVTVTGPGIHRDVPVGASGTYSVTVPAGRYTVTGHSPRYGDGAYLCRAASVATVTSGHATTADVLCLIK